MRFIKSGSTEYARRTSGCQRLIAAALLCAAQVGTTWAQTPTAWTNAGSGVWSDSASWSNGVPNDNAATIGVTGVSYAVTYDAPAAAFRSLTISNSAGYTSTLNIASTDFNPGTNLLFKSGAAVNVNEGGVCNPDPALGQNVFSLAVKAGASLNINGGTMLYTNLMQGSSFNLSDASGGATSVLNVTAGRFEFGGTNGAYAAGAASPDVTIGGSAPGIINISGGTLVFQKTYGLNVGSSSGGRAYVNITGGELVITGQTAATGPYASLGYSSGSGEINVSGDGKLTVYARQFALGYFPSRSFGRINVNGGSANFYSCDLLVGHRSTDSTGIVTVTSGQLTMGGSYYIRLGNDGYYDGRSEGILEIFGGTVTAGGIYAGYASGNRTNKMGRITITNGLLNVSGHIYVANAVNGGRASGEMNISDSGIVTNGGPLVVGYTTNATGIFNQSGGRYHLINTQNGVIGEDGGQGTYNLSNGWAKFHWNLYVGGSAGANSVGALNISGGTLETENTLYLGEKGDGMLKMIGSQGALTVPSLTATTSTSRISFDLGANGAGTVTVSSAVSISTNTSLDITVTNYDWSANGLTVDLISYGSLSGAFGATNVTINGARGDLDGGTILYGDGSNDKIQLQLKKRSSGAIFFMR